MSYQIPKNDVRKKSAAALLCVLVDIHAEEKRGRIPIGALENVVITVRGARPGVHAVITALN